MVGSMTSSPLVVHVCHSLATGGLENGVVNLVNMAAGRFSHAIVCMTETGPLRDRVDRSVEVFSIGKRLGQDGAAFFRLVRLLRRLRPTVVHSRNWASVDAIPAARLARVPLVVHGEHGREAVDPEGRNARRNRIRRFLSPLVDRFVTVSGDLRRWLTEDVRVPAWKVVTINNGVDLSKFASGDRQNARRVLGLPGEALVIGTVGRLDPVKDQALLLRAFASLGGACRNARLVVGGGGPCRAALAQQGAVLGISDRLHLMGERHDIPLVLSAFDLFVLPSIAEGSSNTILEAMASGLPIVATRVGGNPELVEDTVNGRLVPAGSTAELAASIGGYLEDPHLRTLHGKASRQRAVELFGLERMVDAYVSLYARLFDLNRRGSH
jgi:sugar transferase (PEP-CTERM/EpsH1 system associated)